MTFQADYNETIRCLITITKHTQYYDDIKGKLNICILRCVFLCLSLYQMKSKHLSFFPRSSGELVGDRKQFMSHKIK